MSSSDNALDNSELRLLWYSPLGNILLILKNIVGIGTFAEGPTFHPSCSPRGTTFKRSIPCFLSECLETLHIFVRSSLPCSEYVKVKYGLSADFLHNLVQYQDKTIHAIVLEKNA